jgi:cation diffusion facilitator family transporter
MNMRPDPASAVSVSAEERKRVTHRVTLVGAVLNLVLSAVKIWVGFVAHSQSLIADGVHSLSDLLSDALVMVAAHHSHQDPDEQHPYGHGRFETAATLGLALLLALVGAGLVWDAADRMFAPATLLVPGVIALWAAAISVLSKEWLYHYTRIAARRIRSDMMRANAWHHRSDAVSSVVVLVGVGGTMAGLPYLDAVAAALVGLMIIKIGWDLGWGSVRELVDTALDAERVAAIRGTILSVGGVRDIHMLRTRRMGGGASADVHVLVEPRLSVSEGHMIGTMVEQRLTREIDELVDVTVHVDPEDDEHGPSCLDLPLRTEAEARLQRAWAGVPAAAGYSQLLLHYLNGRIHVDVFFPSAGAEMAPGPAGELCATLQDCLAGFPEFGAVRVFFGPCTKTAQ